MSKKLHEGISIQYGTPDGTIHDLSRARIHFNFTVYDNGEVQIRDRENTIIMERDAFIALMHLFSRGTDRSYLLAPKIWARLSSSEDSSEYIMKFVNALLAEGGALEASGVHPATWAMSGDKSRSIK